MITQILPANEQSLAQAEQLILSGEPVAFHTETVYGLGADARRDDAVRKIFELKGRPADNPLIAHVHADYDISLLVDEIPDYAVKLRAAYLPGPLTMVYPSMGKVSSLVSCGLNTLAIRVPSSETAQKFLRKVNIPIAAPSANLSKHVSPVTAQHVYDDFKGRIPLILDGGPCSGGIESTVLDCTGEIPVILRAGLISREMIEQVAGSCGVYLPREGEKPKSPGMAYKHYAPRCKTVLCRNADEAQKIFRKEKKRGGKPYILCESGRIPELQVKGNRILDMGSTQAQMASRLYDLLRKKEGEATLIVAILPKEKGGGKAGVLNRLTRACGENK